MYVMNVSDYDYITSCVSSDYDNITSSNDDMILTNCTNSEKNIEIVIPLITVIPCGLSLLCSKSSMVYTLIKSLFNKKFD